ncbi:hypothetical protein SDC9_128957 [bioreactor metagenome]|uniref:Uncharacterized protein n=1 Tax=bioreactor metagenome TaxID=1076179 RepID=A0A645CXJ1_9ZZZZ
MQLGIVANQQHLRAGILGKVGNTVQRQSARQGGFVDDDELPRLEGGAVQEMVLPPLRGVLGRDAEVIGEHLCCDG